MPRSRRHLIVRVAAAGALAVLAALPATAGARIGADRHPDPTEGTAGSSGEAARTSGRPLTRRVASTLDGVDVSHWQGDIDWAKVAGAGKRFVFLKATDGAEYVDPTFAGHRSQARANGLSVGAYHFARPDPSRGDARREARHFVSVADPRPGDLLPVLDLETSEGLDQDGVTRWARTWARAVRGLTGVQPLVYTSPYGWANRTGDSPLLAQDGSQLWVAHWGVSSPTLPAGGWGGRGWVVWQHSSTGHVRGIEGDVDLDRLAGTRLGVVTIRRLTIEVSGDGRVSSRPAGLGCADSCVHSADPDVSVTITAVAGDDDAHFSRWTGACEGAGVTCTLSMRDDRATQAVFVTDVTAPTATVPPSEGASGPPWVRFDEPVQGVGRSSLVLQAGDGDRLRARRVCRGASGPISCATTQVRAVSLRPSVPLVPGRTYEVTVNPVGAAPLVRDRVGNPVATASFVFEAR